MPEPKNLHTTRNLVASLRKEGKLQLNNNTYYLTTTSEASYTSEAGYTSEASEGDSRKTIHPHYLTSEVTSPDTPTSEGLVTSLQSPVEPMQDHQNGTLTSLTSVTSRDSGSPLEKTYQEQRDMAKKRRIEQRPGGHLLVEGTTDQEDRQRWTQEVKDRLAAEEAQERARVREMSASPRHRNHQEGA